MLATVILNTDTGQPGELRTVLAAAVPNESIDFQLASGNETIVLTQGDLAIDTSLTIDGANSSGSGLAVTIDGDDSSRVFNVDDGDGTINTSTVTIRNLTISGGNAANGGGVANTEQLTLDNVDVTGNTTLATGGSDVLGGGISNRGSLILQNSRVEQNTSQFSGVSGSSGSGGGVASTGSGSSLALINSSVSNNEAIGGTGGGIFVSQSVLTIADSTVSGNRAGLDTSVHGAIQRYDYGGGIAAYSQGNSAPLDVTITDSTIADNVLSNDGLSSLVFPYGGGVFVKGQGNVSISGSALTGNSATGNNLGSSVISRGGGMWIYGQDNGTLYVDIDQTTIDGNFSYNQGGGVGIRGRDNGNVRATISESSISNNTAGVEGRGQGAAIYHWALSASTPGASQLRVLDSTLSGNMTVDGIGRRYSKLAWSLHLFRE